MSYDLFLSYSRRDNGQGRITAGQEPRPGGSLLGTLGQRARKLFGR